MTGTPGMRRGLGRGLLVGALALALIGAVPPSTASGSGHGSRLTVTYNEKEFLAANKIAVTKQFDHPIAFAPQQRTVTFQGVRFWSKDQAAPYWTVAAVEGATQQCPQQCSLFRKFTDGSDTGDAVVTFRKGGAVRSFGFLLNPFGTSNQFVIRVVEADGTVTSFWLRRNAGDTYLGLSSRVGIEKIVIWQRADLVGGWTNFGFDRVSRSYITFPQEL